jgi:hypothetical protein
LHACKFPEDYTQISQQFQGKSNYNKGYDEPS